MDSIDFYYNGKTSDEMGIYMIQTGGGMKSTPFLAEREIISEKIAGNDIPYVHGMNRSPLSLKLTLSCLDGLWTYEKRRELARWLDVDGFKEFYSYDKPSKKYYLSYVGGIDLTHNGNQQGYIEVEFKNISPYSYSPILTKDFDLSNIITTTTIDLTNDGDNDLLPELWITKKGISGDVQIKNMNDGGKVFLIKNLSINNEIVYFDNKYRHIETSLPLLNRYDDFNGNYLKLKRGINKLEVTGACVLNFKYQFETKG